MTELKTKEYKKFENIKHIREDESEFWSALELADALEYSNLKVGKWIVIQRCINNQVISYGQRYSFISPLKGLRCKIVLFNKT